MFDNLVESNSHKDDITRKGSFIGITALIYGVLLLTFFVAGIYWYDARLGDMELELTTLVAPVPVPQQQKEPDKPQEAKPQKNRAERRRPERVDRRRRGKPAATKRDFG
jgi:hypothetical protein